MKKVITTVIICVSLCSMLRAQNIPAQGSYITDNTMGAFHGTWQWVSGTDTVKIYLITQKVYIDVNGGFYHDCIVGWHLYKKGNQVIESSFNFINTPRSNGQNTILAWSSDSGAGLEGSLKDITRNKDCDLKLTLNAAQNKLTWYSARGEGLHIVPDGKPIPPRGLTLPTQMVFTKL